MYVFVFYTFFILTVYRHKLINLWGISDRDALLEVRHGHKCMQRLWCIWFYWKIANYWLQAFRPTVVPLDRSCELTPLGISHRRSFAFSPYQEQNFRRLKLFWRLYDEYMAIQPKCQKRVLLYWFLAKMRFKRENPERKASK